jgi:hypothetical protein
MPPFHHVSNLIVNNPITLGYTIPPTKGQIGYVQTNSFSTLYVPTNDTLNCYAPIQYTNLPAGLYAINYYCTGINYWGAIALVSSTITKIKVFVVVVTYLNKK